MSTKLTVEEILNLPDDYFVGRRRWYPAMTIKIDGKVKYFPTETITYDSNLSQHIVRSMQKIASKITDEP